MIRKRFQVSKEGEVLIKHIFEGHEGIAFITTVDRKRSLLDFYIGESDLSEATEIFAWLRQRSYMREIPIT